MLEGLCLLAELHEVSEERENWESRLRLLAHDLVSDEAKDDKYRLQTLADICEI